MFNRNLRVGLVLLIPLALLACDKKSDGKADATREKLGEFVDTAKKDGKEVLDKGKDLAADAGDAISAHAQAGWKQLEKGCAELKDKAKDAKGDAKTGMEELGAQYEEKSAALHKQWDELAGKTGDAADQARSRIDKAINDLNIEFEAAKKKYL